MPEDLGRMKAVTPYLASREKKGGWNYDRKEHADGDVNINRTKLF
jgi:hypothetical protein